MRNYLAKLLEMEDHIKSNTLVKHYKKPVINIIQELIPYKDFRI